MKKRFLGIVAIVYSCIILYVWIFDILKNFLAPSMQIYIKLSLIPMFLISLVMLFNNKVNYKFKISDLVLILPLVLLILAGDGRLTSSFASNRTTNFNTENRIKNENDNVVVSNENEDNLQELNIEGVSEEHDFSSPYFNIVDANYNELSNYITFSPKADKYKGKTIKVRGFALTKASFITDDYFLIGKYAISCCAADAGFTGFVVKHNDNKILNDKWYEIEGILEKGKDKDGYDIMYIEVINLKEIDSKDEEQYVYPCYSYDDGTCEAISVYDLEY
ncbi:MAG: TIGR03943 family protein [Bacilli bacterium]|nr:TIGR03943 family protein [Bacilli bacterium]